MADEEGETKPHHVSHGKPRVLWSNQWGVTRSLGGEAAETSGRADVRHTEWRAPKSSSVNRLTSKLEFKASTHADALSLMSPITKLILAMSKEKERYHCQKICPHWRKKKPQHLSSSGYVYFKVSHHNGFGKVWRLQQKDVLVTHALAIQGESECFSKI